MCKEVVTQWLCCHCGAKADEPFTWRKQCSSGKESGAYCQDGLEKIQRTEKRDWMVCGPCQIAGRTPIRGLYSYP